ncbi:uncharacterized protein LOC101478499 [Maylandia zebra]|uniref:uncharacterized protein LOC101478499 n=1 Tax=Maylandia zebra TaxID=106582 RepID=UPI00403C18AF
MLVLWITLFCLHKGYSLVPVETVQLGEPATLTCAIPKELSIRGVNWYKQSVGDTLKLIVTLIQSKADFGPGFSSSRFRINSDANFSSLIILETVQEDEGHYHCTNTEWIGTTWGGTYLLVKGKAQRTSNFAVSQLLIESNPVRPGDTMTLQCSVFSDSDNKTCPGGLNILWVREGSDKSLPNIIYTDKNRSNECEKRSDHQKTCVYHFSKNVSSSDAGTYYCAVATCGEILFGSGTKLVIQGCTDYVFFGTKTTGVGENVTLTCERPTSEYEATLYWIRIVSGSWPEFMGGTFTFDYDGVNTTPHITAKQEPGTFILEISQTRLSDTGLYYCIKVDQLDMDFLNATFLKIKGPETAITDIIQVPQSGPLHPGNPVTLQCSVLSNPENSACPGNDSVFWFSTRSDNSHPNLIYADGNSDKCERSPEASSTQKCVYSFSKNVSSSDAGSYYCAVATCGHIIFGNGIKLDVKGLNMWDLQKANTVLFILCAALATSLIVIAFLIYTIKKKTSSCWCDVGTGSGDQHSQQTVVVYSAPNITSRKSSKLPQRSEKAAEGGTVYTDVSASAVE